MKSIIICRTFSEHIDDIASSMPTDVDIDIWNPDFNCDAHFPLITTAIETFKLGSKYFSDDDINMESAFESRQPNWNDCRWSLSW